jgi:hypothetical protein
MSDDIVTRLRAVLDAIDALHQPVTVWELHDGSVPVCACGIESCPTARLLHPMTLDEAIDMLGTVHK